MVRNIMAAGTATLTIDGEDVSLESPRLIGKAEAWDQITQATKAPPDFLKVTEYLLMDVAASG